MINGFEVITLCGSTKFKKEFQEYAQALELMGDIVLSVNVFSHNDNITHSEETYKRLKNIHYAKIDISDSIFVINVDDYIGNSTKKEIEYAKSLGKKITYAYPHKEE